ncbi:hypothetical protein X781_13030 [Mannheimia sp. USDA-ARS-USMARC-1261]|nr:hypothetical protein X781_13030 [Mannheimia sp. USDA-ARS-USMARC-1261]
MHFLYLIRTIASGQISLNFCKMLTKSDRLFKKHSLHRDLY